MSEKVEAFKAAIVAAVEKVKSKGVTIGSQNFGFIDDDSEETFKDSFCCPLTALCWAQGREDISSKFPSLNVDEREAWAFIQGFDGHTSDDYMPVHNDNPELPFPLEFWTLGAELRNLFSPKDLGLTGVRS